MGKRVEIGVAEPTLPQNSLSGRVIRVLLRTGGLGLTFHFAIVDLDEPYHWDDRVLRYISFMARSRGKSLEDISSASLWSNLMLAPDWLLECSEDDSRILMVQDWYIGFGEVRLAGVSGD